jgi:hypothetical protein
MNNTEQTTVFAGLDGRTGGRLPEWYRGQTDAEDPVPFAQAVRQLPRATRTRVAYQNPYSNRWVATDRFNAIIEPSRAMDQVRDESVDSLFHVPTDSYSIINPTDVYAPLETVLRETELDGRTLGEVMFGEIRQYRGGGEVHMDIMFDGLEVQLPGDREPITMGLTSGYDFFGGHAVYVEGFARDNACANSIRSLTDRQIVKHVGDIGDFGEWWEGILEALALVSNDLYAFIEDAQEIDIDFAETPFDVAAFYELIGFPEYLAERAADDALAASDGFVVVLWVLHSGATHALTHFFRGREGGSLDRYVRAANDLLFNPERTLSVVERTYREQAEAETVGGQTGIESQVALAQLERVEADLREKADQFEAREAMLRERFESTTS